MFDSLWPCGLQHARLPVLHYLPELAQTHAHWMGDAIQPSHPLWSPSPPALNLSQQQGLVQWAGSSHQVANILELQLQHQSCQWISRVDFLQNRLVRGEVGIFKCFLPLLASPARNAILKIGVINPIGKHIATEFGSLLLPSVLSFPRHTTVLVFKKIIQSLPLHRIWQI